MRAVVKRVAACGRRSVTVALTAAAVSVTLTSVALGGTMRTASGDMMRTVSGSLGTTGYAIGKPLCPAPKPGHMRCFSIRRVEVAKGTPGARPYRPPGGAAPGAAMAGPAETIGPAGGLTPFDLAKAYGYNSAANAAGQTVAIVDAYNDPRLDRDLQAFDTRYRLSTCSTSNGCLTIVNQRGGRALPADDESGWSGEETLDVQTVHAVCQSCKIILLEAANPSTANFNTAENEAARLGATEISNSFGAPESGATSAMRSAFNHPGIVITASSGDDGYNDFDEMAAVNQPNAPASLNTVVAVGGTSLYLGQRAARQSESVWNDNGTKDYWQQTIGVPLGASGGGCSTRFPAPLWQKSLSVWASTACGQHRLANDISADGDYLTGFDIYDTYVCGLACPPPGWSTIGGTSLSSPIIASMFALAGGAHGVAYPALTLYGHSGSSSLYDVTSGGNGYCDGEGAAACGDPNTGGQVLDCDYPATGTTPSVGDRACDALRGYDGPTGLGTPKGLAAFAKTGPTATVTGPTSVMASTTHQWTASTHDPFPGGVITSYSWNWGDGSATSVTATGAAPHAYSAAGTYMITLTVKDNYRQAQVTTYTVKVAA
jgi:hypothetical protein